MNVQPGGFASDLGVQHGDIILSINHHPVVSVEDFNRLQSSLKSGADVLLLARDDPNVSRLMVWEVMTWGMLSHAERLAPGALLRGSRGPRLKQNPGQ